MAEWLANANSITALIASIFGLVASLFGATVYIKNKVLKKLLDLKNKKSKKPAKDPDDQTDVTEQMDDVQMKVTKIDLTLLEWMEVIASGSVHFLSMGRIEKWIEVDDGGIDEFPIPMKFVASVVGLAGLLVMPSTIVSLLTSLLLWSIGIEGYGKPAWVIFSLLLISFAIATWSYHVGKRAETKILEKSEKIEADYEEIYAS